MLQAGLTPPPVAVQASSFGTGLQIVRGGDYVMAAPMPLAGTLAETGLAMVPPDAPFWRFRSGLWVRRSSLQYPIVRFVIEQMRTLFAP